MVEKEKSPFLYYWAASLKVMFISSQSLQSLKQRRMAVCPRFQMFPKPTFDDSLTYPPYFRETNVEVMLRKQFLSLVLGCFPQFLRVNARAYGARTRKICEFSQLCSSIFRHISVFSSVDCIGSGIKEITAHSYSQRKHEWMPSSKKVKGTIKRQIHLRRQNHVNESIEEILLHNRRWAS